MSSKPTTENPALTTPRDQQPASEWASSTLAAFDPANDSASSQSPPKLQSAPETPGLSMPGSFPLPKQAFVAPDVQGAATGALQTAKEYAQSAAQGAQSAVQSAGDKAGEYLPSSITSYLSSGTPQEMEMSQNDHSSSALPPTGETSVADECATGTGGQSVDQAVSSPILTTTNNNPADRRPFDPLERHTGYIPDTLHDDTSLAKLPEERRLGNLPSHDDEAGERLGKSGGVGALPGSAGESSVALLPDERNEVLGEARSGASTDASTRTLPGSSYAASYTPSPLAQSHFVPQTTGREHAFSRDEEKIFGADATKDLDAPEAVDTKAGEDKTVPVVSDVTGDDGQQQQQHAVGAGSGELAGAGTATQVVSEIPKKSGFIHKVKGEMKVLSGKMSHNESKIAEGRKMMSKN